jgi:transposase
VTPEHLPGTAQDRHAGRGLAVQARRAGHAPGPASSPTTDPPGCGTPARYRADLVAVRGEAAGGAGCRVDAGDQALGGGQRQLRVLRAGHAPPRWWSGSATRRSQRSWPAARLRANSARWPGAFTGLVTDQHAFAAAQAAGQVDAPDADLGRAWTPSSAELTAGFANAVDRPDEIPGVGQVAARLLLAELGADTGQVPDRRAAGVVGHLRRRRQRVRRQPRGQRIDRARPSPPWLACSARPGVAAGKTDTFLGERHRRIARRRGTRRAIVAVGRSILVIAWHLLSDRPHGSRTWAPACYDTRSNAERAKRNHIRQLEASATRSPCNPPPDPAHQAPVPPRSDPGSARTLPRACSTWIFGSDPHGRWPPPGMRIGRPGQARLSLVQQSPLLRGRFSFQDALCAWRAVSAACRRDTSDRPHPAAKTDLIASGCPDPP